MEFEPLFEEAIVELELAGLGKNTLELMMEYLGKVGPYMQKEILKDTRAWSNADGTETTRKAESWDEYHKILLEHEATTVNANAVANTAYSVGNTAEETGGKGRGKGRKQEIARIRARAAELGIPLPPAGHTRGPSAADQRTPT